MSKIKLIILVLLFTLLLCSCGSEASIENALLISASYSVPAMFEFDLKGRVCEIIEQDSYGRIIFATTGDNLLTGNDEEVIVISQKYDSGWVYFYEDLNYIFADHSEEALKNLKMQNDWNMPLDESKMSRRPISYALDLVIKTFSNLDMKKVRAIWQESLNVSNDQIVDASIDDVDGFGKELFVVIVENESGEYKYYFSIVDENYNVTNMLIDNISDFSESLIQFKHANGWHTGW